MTLRLFGLPFSELVVDARHEPRVEERETKGKEKRVPDAPSDVGKGAPIWLMQGERSIM